MGKWRYSFILTSVLDGGEWSASHPCRFTLKEIASGTNWIGRAGPRGSLDTVEKRKIFAMPGVEPGLSSP
jgi:hypothetical protein